MLYVGVVTCALSVGIGTSELSAWLETCERHLKTDRANGSAPNI